MLGLYTILGLVHEYLSAILLMILYEEKAHCLHHHSQGYVIRKQSPNWARKKSRWPASTKESIHQSFLVLDNKHSCIKIITPRRRRVTGLDIFHGQLLTLQVRKCLEKTVRK